MICRAVIHEQTPGSIASDEARSFREWIKAQPGFIAGYHAQDSQTLKSISITVWESKESMRALRDRTPPGGPVGLTTDWQEIYDIVEEF